MFHDLTDSSDFTPDIALNVNENVSPLFRKPESQTAVSEVDVCVIWPVFTQQTVVPTGTVTSDFVAPSACLAATEARATVLALAPSQVGSCLG